MNFEEIKKKYADRFKKKDLSELDLQNANLFMAPLKGFNLQLANLIGANLGLARLQRSNLQGAHLKNAKLQWAYLTEANLIGAKLEGAQVTCTTISEIITDDKGNVFNNYKYLEEYQDIIIGYKYIKWV